MIRWLQKTMIGLLAALAVLLGLALPAQAQEEVTAKISDLQILVNQQNPLPAYLEPEDLVSVTDFVKGNGNVRLRAEAAQALREMLAGLRAAGITDIYANSGYRSYSRQNELYTAKVNSYRRGNSTETAEALAAGWVLPPGSSEHQTGLAIDLSTASIKHGLTGAFATTPAGQWLAAHCVEYGFIIRYTQEKVAITGVNPEPWHFRYVGKDHAYYLQTENICLDEYHSRLKEQQMLTFANAAGEQRAVYYCYKDTSAELPGTVLSVSLARKNSGEYVITTIPAPPPLFDTIGHWAEQSARRLYEQGLIEGYPDGSFQPAREISRAEFVTMLARLPLPAESWQPKLVTPPQTPDAVSLEQEGEATPQPPAEDIGEAPQDDAAGADTATEIGEQEESPDETDQADGDTQPPPGGVAEKELLYPLPLPYQDIDAAAFYYEALCRCYQAGLLAALPQQPGQPPSFIPNQPLLRGQAAQILLALFDSADYSPPIFSSYADIPSSDADLLRAVEYLSARGIFQGDNNGFFLPSQPLSRAEISALFCRLLDTFATPEQQNP